MGSLDLAICAGAACFVRGSRVSFPANYGASKSDRKYYLLAGRRQA